MLRPRSLVTILCALIALAVLAAPAQASTQPAAGTFVEAPETILEERQSGGNTFIHLTRGVTFTGTYTGLGQADQRIVIHADGTFNVHMTIEFAGVACGAPVELTFLVVGRGDFNANVLTGTYTVIGPGPVGKGHGEFVAEPGVGGVHEGSVHCD
jgi:hypothetical protein